MAHVVGRNAVHLLGLLSYPAEEVPASNYDGESEFPVSDIRQFSSNE